MRTNRKRSDVIVVFKLQKTNGALTVTAVTAALGSIDGEWNRLDDGFVEAVRGEHMVAIRMLEERRIVRERIQVAAGGGREVRSGAPSSPPPPPPPAAVAAYEEEDWRDDVAGDEARVSDDEKGRSDDDNHCD